MRLWDAQTGERILQPDVPGVDDGFPVRLDVSPDGTRIAVLMFNGPVAIWSVPEKRLLRKLTGLTPRSEGSGWGLAFNPGGERIAAANDRMVIVWDVASGQQKFRVELPPHSFRDLEFSPDGKWLAVSRARDGSALSLLDAETGKLLSQYKVPRAWLLSIAFSPDGERLANVAASKEDITLRIIKPESGEELLVKSLEVRVLPRLIRFSHDGRHIFSSKSCCPPILFKAAFRY